MRISDWSSDVCSSDLPLTGTEYIHYDPRGPPAQRLFANGDSVHYEYDAGGRPLRITEKNTQAEQTTTLSWRGPLLSRTSHPHETETRDYDKHKRSRQRTISRAAAGTDPLRYRESFKDRKSTR